MPPNRPNLSKIASTAIPQDGHKLHAPSALRNRDAIIRAIRPFMPATGNALEIASGTGEHVPHYGAAFPNILWQPTDIESDRLKSITARAAESGLGNILPARFLDATQAGWASAHSGQDVIILSNLLHLISKAETQTLIAQAALALSGNGVFLIYGPFMRGKNFASAGDQDFHKALQSKHPEIGYKSLQSIQMMQTNAGLEVLDVIEMPSNNLILVARNK